MMTPSAHRSFAADEGGPLALAKDFLINHNLYLESLTWENTGADAAFIQVFNVPRKLAVAVVVDTAGDTTGLLSTPSPYTTHHGFITGDRVTLTGIAGVTSGYFQANDIDFFRLYATRAQALGTVGGATGLILPTTNGDDGTLSLYSDNATAPLYEEYPVLGSGSAPSNIGSYTNANFTRGLYVRAVTAAGGSTLVGSAVVRFTPRYLSGPIAGATSYED